MRLMSMTKKIWMGAGDGFVVVTMVVVVAEEVVVVIVIVVGGMVVGDVSFAIVGCGGKLCLMVVLRGGARLVVERVVGGIGLGCGVREGRFVGIVVGRLLLSCDGWILLEVFVVFVGKTLELWFGFAVLVGLLKEQKRL